MSARPDNTTQRPTPAPPAALSSRRPAARRAALDSIDLKILAVLQQSGRISKSALAAQVGLSASACLERMKLLEQKKLILSYHADVNLSALCRHETFVTEVTLKSHRAGDFFQFERYVRGQSNIVECLALGGGIDYVLKFVAPDIASYQEAIDCMLDAEVGVDKYFTYVVTKQVKTSNFVPLEALLPSTE